MWEEQEELADPAPTPEDQIIAQEDLYRLARVWGDLDERTQYLLSARYILKKSSKEEDSILRKYEKTLCAIHLYYQRDNSGAEKTSYSISGAIGTFINTKLQKWDKLYTRNTPAV